MVTTLGISDGRPKEPRPIARACRVVSGVCGMDYSVHYTTTDDNVSGELDGLLKIVDSLSFN